MKPSSGVRFEPVAGALGAVVHGVDLARPLDDADLAALQGGLAEHLVLFFYDQVITPAQHRDFALRFGPIMRHEAYPHAEGVPEVTVLDHSAERPSLIEEWHTDMTFKPNPPLGSVLRARILPDRGGDTMWASMHAAWEGLSDRMQRLLDGLEAVHDFSYGFKESLARPGGRERLAAMVAAHPPVRHPVVRTHPVTGRKGLFVNRLFTTHIEGLNRHESRSILRFLYQHMVVPEYTCRFRWRPDAIAFWDNRATQHRPVNDHGLRRRTLNRVTIEGDVPS